MTKYFLKFDKQHGDPPPIYTKLNGEIKLDGEGKRQSQAILDFKRTSKTINFK